MTFAEEELNRLRDKVREAEELVRRLSSLVQSIESDVTAAEDSHRARPAEGNKRERAWERRETVGDGVRRLMQEQGFTAADLSNVLEVSPSQVSRLLNGKSRFRSKHLMVVARWLGEDPRELMGLPSNGGSVLLTVGECAEISRRHPQTVRNAIYNGALVSQQHAPRGRHLVKSSDLDFWISNPR